MTRHCFTIGMLVAMGLSACVTDDQPFDEFGDGPGDGKADGTDDGFPRLDVNDVSILYPLPTSAAGLSGLPGLDTMTARGPILSRDQFTKLVSMIHPEEDTELRGLHYEDWHIVAVRVDPCEMLAPGMPCTAQIRLVAQSFDPANQSTGVRTDDNAMHLVFSLSNADAKPMFRDLVHLKTANAMINTSGKPLGVHPTLKNQGLSGKLATDLRTLITTYVGKAIDQKLAVMFTLNAGNWRFASATVVGTEVQQVPVPCSTTPTISMMGTTGVVGNFINHVSPAGTCADNINKIIDSAGKDAPPFQQGSFFRLSADEQGKDIDLALRVINPTLNRVGTTDCVACHAASRALARVKDSAFLNLNDHNPNRFVPPKLVTTNYKPSAEDAGGAYNVRGFGYQGSDVAYSQAAVNLSALAADDINQQIRKDKLLTP